jgi:hypothetical protein
LKQYIVLISMIALGVFIYGLISGDSPDGNSLTHTAGASMKSAMESGLGGSASLPPAIEIRMR